MIVRFCTVGEFFDRDLPAVPAVGDTVRTYERGEVNPILSWVSEVVWNIPSPSAPAMHPFPVSVEVHLTSKPPKGR